MSEQSQEFVRLAGEAIREGNFASAVDLANQALAIDPHSAEAYMALGIAQAQSGQPDAATSSLRHAISIAPNNPKGYYNLATHQYQMNHKMEAIAMAEEALRLDPSFVAAKNLMNLIQSEFDASRATHASAAELETLPTMAPPPTAHHAAPPAHGPVQHSPMSHAPMTGPAMRPGYAPASSHGLRFVENMGRGWDTIGFILQFGLLVAIIVIVVGWLPLLTNIVDFSRNSQGNRAELDQYIRSITPAWLSILQVISTLAYACNIIWTAIDIADRKNSWAWMILTVCCYPLSFIYSLAGRK